VRTIEADLSLNASVYETESERALDSAYRQAAALVNGAEPASGLCEALVLLQGPINNFFDTVMVNAEDAAVRQARQALVQHIARLPQGIADLSKLQGF
jgi:glycyl-tRNA synthetase beta subunit